MNPKCARVGKAAQFIHLSQFQTHTVWYWHSGPVWSLCTAGIIRNPQSSDKDTHMFVVDQR
jgi:hypothetical protein